MKTLLILIPIILLGIAFAGGLGKENPFGTKAPPDQYATLEEGTPIPDEKTLQLRNIPATIHTAASPSPTGTACTPNTKVAVDLLLDTSGSMFGNKIATLISAVTTFGSKLETDDLVGIQSFSSPPVDLTTCSKLGSNEPACEVLNLTEFNQASFNQAVNQLIAGGNTHMRDGFEKARQVIASKRNLPEYQDYNWVLIFLSDGIPNDTSIYGPGPDSSQNPTPIADEMKNPGGLNVRIISIGLDLDSIINNYVATFTINRNDVPTYARTLLQNIASDPPANNPTQRNYFESATANDLDQIYRDISGQIGRACPTPT